MKYYIFIIVDKASDYLMFIIIKKIQNSFLFFTTSNKLLKSIEIVVLFL